MPPPQLPQGDPAASLEFLRWLRPAGPWCLTVIPPEGGVTETATFRPADADRLREWLAERCGKLNIYFMVNLQRRDLSSKAKKDDVAALEFLHVDIDPAKPPKDMEGDQRALSAWNAQERERIIGLLSAREPAPSAVIDSGGGYQAFWRLDESIQVNGQIPAIEEAEAYNIQLANELGGDNCHNADRIMRLPGTINVPGERKRKKGRVPALSRTISLREDVHPLKLFTPAPRVQDSGARGPGASAPAVKLSGNLQRVDLEKLPERVTPRIRQVIVEGDDPTDPNKYGSRSDAVWAVLCHLVRAGCDDDTLASILTDPDYGISAHVRDQPRPTEYAARQIQRAREEVEEPMLRKLNERHAVIEDLGGKCRIISEVEDAVLGRTRISKQSFEDFRNRYMHIQVQIGEAKGKPVFAPAGAWWLKHPLRRQYHSMVFAPGREVPGCYNLWRGFAVDAVPGDGHLLYLEHLRQNICSGDESHYRYLVGWMARAVQNPGEAGEVAVVLRGGEGTGKGTFANIFGSLFGRHFMHLSSAKHLVGQFNSHLRDCVVIHADEAFFAGDKQHEGVLKALVTEPTLVVEGKGVDAEVGPNYTHIMMSSNSVWVVPAGADARRWYVLDVGDAQKQSRSYFTAIRKAMANGGRENLLHHLLTIDLSKYEVRDVPQTDALADQKVLTMGPEEQWWLERLTDGRVASGSVTWDVDIAKDRVQGDYLAYCERQRIFRRVSPSALGRFLSKMMPEGFPVVSTRTVDVERHSEFGGAPEMVKERTSFYTLPSLEECRREMEKRYGKFTWPPDESVRRGPDPY